MRITKTSFLNFLKQPIHFWAILHDEITNRRFGEFQQHLALQGQATERLAKAYLEEIILPQYQDAELLWQAEFIDGVFYAKLDGLVHNKSTNQYDIYEIKASTTPSNYVHDVAFQHMVCEANINVGHTYILHLNKAYHRAGELELSELFQITQMDNDIQSIHNNIAFARQLAVKVASLPDADSLSSCRKPKDCPCPHLCHPDLPAYSIYDIPRIKKDKIATLLSQGIVSIEDIPNDFPLSDLQRSVVSVIQNGSPVINHDAICQTLAEIKYPIAFFDYEAVITAIPAFDGYHPNQNMAFQYSLHVLREENAELEHYQFLADGDGDPAYGLVQQLAHNMPDDGSIVVWNKTYEATINKGLASLYPEYREFALSLNDRLYDLMLVFSKQLYQHPDFHGSASIKSVLPVLVPTMTYVDMPVGHGGQAVHAWNQMTADDISDVDRAKLRRDMLAYCEQDTLAMVEIWNFLKTLC